MKTLQVALMILFVIALPLTSYGQEKPCFAFLRTGDVYVSCDSKLVQITHRGDVEGFAVSDERSTLGYITSTVTKRTATIAGSVHTTTLADLKTGAIRQVVGDNFVISTCGGLFWEYDKQRKQMETRELIAGDEMAAAPYSWFRCSSDRKITIGVSGGRARDLYEGLPPQTRVASTGSFYPTTFNISPNGAEVAFFTDRSPLCVVSAPGPIQCSHRSGTIPDAPSVDDSGQVLFAVSTDEECFYKSAANFSTQRFAGATEENFDTCVAVGYWKAGLKAVTILEPIGRSPQWISPITAKLMRDWAARTSAAGK